MRGPSTHGQATLHIREIPAQRFGREGLIHDWRSTNFQHKDKGLHRGFYTLGSSLLFVPIIGVRSGSHLNPGIAPRSPFSHWLFFCLALHTYPHSPS